MIYYNGEKILIRDLKKEDIQIITEEEIKQGWHVTSDKYEMRYKHQQEGKSINIVAEYEGNLAGYINVYPNPDWPPFNNTGYSEIVDFGVLVKYRNKGIGSKLLDIAEEIGLKYSDIICLTVGVHSGYGSAQRMYVKRGYIPDGKGLLYKGEYCEPYKEYMNDDNLQLAFIKRNE